MAKEKYTGLRGQVYTLAASLGVNTQTMGGSRTERGIDNIGDEYLPVMLSDLKQIQKRTAIRGNKE